MPCRPSVHVRCQGETGRGPGQKPQDMATSIVDGDTIWFDGELIRGYRAEARTI